MSIEITVQKKDRWYVSANNKTSCHSSLTRAMSKVVQLLAGVDKFTITIER
jgi:hypothetical protein